MNAKLIALFIAALLGCNAYAATTGAAGKQWDAAKPLLWADFAAPVPFEADSALSYMEADLIAQPSAKVEKGATLVHVNAQAVMFPSRSWVSEAGHTPQRLRYHQLQFNLLELLRRQLQEDINSGISGEETENRVRQYNALYDMRMAQLDTATRGGQDSLKLAQWEQAVQRQLGEAEAAQALTLVPRDVCYGFFAGVGGGFPTGDLSDNFKGCFLFQAGLTAGYKWLRIKADVAYGQPSFNNDNIFNVKDDNGRDLQGNAHAYASLLMAGGDVGVCVYDSRRLAITPSFGGYWSRYKWETLDYTWGKNPEGKDAFTITDSHNAHLSDFNWRVSIDFDIKLASHVSNTPFFLTGHREQYTSMLRISPFLARASYKDSNPAAKGFHVGFTVAYVGLARSLIRAFK